MTHRSIEKLLKYHTIMMENGVPPFLTTTEQFEIIGSNEVCRLMSDFAKKELICQVAWMLSNGDGTYQRLYDRIVIRRKSVQQ
jgi:hypothetical protein